MSQLSALQHKFTAAEIEKFEKDELDKERVITLGSIFGGVARDLRHQEYLELKRQQPNLRTKTSFSSNNDTCVSLKSSV
jgi:hypothetical protein